jgi:hypothetical protein
LSIAGSRSGALLRAGFTAQSCCARQTGPPCTAKRIAGELKANHPDAAASLFGGLGEMFTVRPFGVGGRLATTLINASCIESMMSVARTTMGNVKNWKDGSMKKRWVAAGCSKRNGTSAASAAAKRCPISWPLFAATSRPVTPANYDQAVG